MERDPYYQQIIEALNRPLDEALFQRCVGDLLGSYYPGLVPFSGGDDAGMDGAVPDGEGEPFPLIVTSGEDAIGNLTRNLNSYLRDNRRRRKAVFATSKQLSPRRIQNLYNRADELGFILVNVHHQEDIARLLYRHSEWCRDLLGLVGQPAPLSTIPLSTRPFIDQPITGREQDYKWLIETKGDCLIVGQPGSGKTFLLYKFAKEGRGLFVVSDDLGDIANGLRSLQPDAIIIDDAQVKLELLVNLLHLRKELGVDFSIIASCWPNDKDRIFDDLRIVELKVRTLDLLTRDEIVKVINDAGLGGPVNLVRELVDQAEGRPGLAVTLARLCLLGDVPSIFRGEALFRLLSLTFPLELANRLKLLLASFGIGGNIGMPANVIGEYTGLRTIEIFDLLSTIAPNGVIRESRKQYISVHPQAFRQALVKNVFFQDSKKGLLSVDYLIFQAPDISEAAIILVGVKARGGNVPINLLIDVLEKAGSEKAWINFAWLGRDEVRWLISKHPEKMNAIMLPALEYDASNSIPLLLSRAIGDSRPTHSNLDHPIRILSDWILFGYKPQGEAVRRRGLLLKALQDWINNNGDSSVTVQAIKFVMSPKVEWQETDPGFGNQVSFYQGYLAEVDLNAIQLLWPDVINILYKIGILVWHHISDMFWDWANPILRDQQELIQAETMKKFAGRMLVDLAPIIKNHPGLVQNAIEMAQFVNIKYPVEPDQLFNTLFPSKDIFFKGDYEEIHKKQLLELGTIQDEWLRKSVEEVADLLIYLEAEAKLAGISWPRYTPALCWMITKNIKSPVNWGTIFFTSGLQSDLLEPFLIRAVEINEYGWQDLTLSYLKNPHSIPAALDVLLKHPNPLQELLAVVEALPAEYSDIVEGLCLRNEVPLPTVRYILRSKNVQFARSAAYGEWLAVPSKSVRQELNDDWKKVILNDDVNSTWLPEILKNNEILAYEWLIHLIQTQVKYEYSMHNLISAVSESLNIEQKHAVLDLIQSDQIGSLIVQNFASDSEDLYKHLLSKPILKNFHLHPLSFELKNHWIEKAKLALNHGYTAEEIARAVYGVVGEVTWFGAQSEEESKYLEFFEQLCIYPDPQIQMVGELGKAIGERRVQAVLDEEHREAVYGM